MGYNTSNADYDSYVNRYDWASYPDGGDMMSVLDITDETIQAFFKEIGIVDYATYRIIYSAIIITIFGWFVSRVCEYRNVFMAIYLTFYVILDTIQIRNFSGLVVLLPFIPLLQKNSLLSTLLYVGGVLLSSTIHFSMISFLIFAFINIKSKKLRIIGIILFLLFLVLSASIISSTAAFDRVDGYQRSSVLGALYGATIVIFNYLMMKKATNYYKRYMSGQSCQLTISRIGYGLIGDLNFFLLFIIPIYFINASIGRIFRYMSIINVIFLLNMISMMGIRKSKRMWIVLTIIYISYFALFFIYLKPEVFYPVLTSNSIFTF